MTDRRLTVIEARLRTRSCAFTHEDGRPCGAAPLRDSTFCFWHDPTSADDAADARRVGGLHRRRQRVVAVAYDLAPLDSITGIRRVLETAVLDVLPLEHSVARSRVLVAAALAATRLLEVEALSRSTYERLGDERPTADETT